MIREISDPKIWNAYVSSCTPNTFLHSWEWGQVQKATGEDIRYLSWSEGLSAEAWAEAGVAMVILVNARRGRHYLIPHGPLFRKGTEGVDSYLAELITHLREQAKKDRVVAVRIAPLIETSTESQQLFKNLGFRPAPLHVHAELTWVLDISASPENLLSGMRKTTRHAIRKAEQVGVTCEVISNSTEMLNRFWPLYQQTRQRHGFVLWPKELIKAQLDIFSQTNKIYSVVARYNNQDVAAAILPHFGDTAYYYHGASIKLPSSVPATQLLQWSAIEEAKRRGAIQYNFWGIAPEKEPHHPFAGITTFKKGFGGRAIDYLHAQDLPLSLWYWPLWAIDTYRKFRRGF